VNEVIVVPSDRAGLELDEFLCLALPELSKGFLRRQIRDGRVTVDGEVILPSKRLRADQVLMLDLDDEMPLPPVAPPVTIPVLHEDDETLVVDKPPGLAVEPERWARDAACLSGGLLQIAREQSGGPLLGYRPRIVHRIDKDTSGCVLAAKTLETERLLRAAFESGDVEKEYLALVEGEVDLADDEAREIELALGPDERRSGRQCVRARGGKPAHTTVQVARRFRGYTLLACRPHTGRTHQIRVHLAAIGFPLAVDPVYGRYDSLLLSRIKASYKPKAGRPERPLIDRLTLHAAAITFPRPEGAAPVRVEAPLPRDFERALKQLAKVRHWKRRG
jgi:RluA family pseudouridine synthase